MSVFLASVDVEIIDRCVCVLDVFADSCCDMLTVCGMCPQECPDRGQCITGRVEHGEGETIYDTGRSQSGTHGQQNSSRAYGGQETGKAHNG